MLRTAGLELEQELWNAGKTRVAGVDEAGRGPLAGPVVAAAVVFAPDHEPIEGIYDSKRLSAKRRESLYSEIQENALAVGIGIVEPRVIDRINILKATHKAMRQAIGRLRLRLDHVLIDGRGLPDKIVPQTAVASGDRKSYSIAAASIIAKVHRDRLLMEYDNVFPGYGFAQHKGYGTRQHLEALARWKATPIHRRSFHPVAEHLPDPALIKNTRTLGKFGEDMAAYYLYRKGYRMVERNYHFGAYGELDIIAQRGDRLAFVEVKTQRSDRFGDAETWVDERKQQQIGSIAGAYLGEHPGMDVECHFDVIAVRVQRKSVRIHYIEDAFRL